MDEGKIVWLTLAEKHDLWLASHPNPNDYFLFQCDDVVSSALENPVGEVLFDVFPNPSTGKVTVRTDLTGVLELVVANALWQVVFYEKMEVQEVAVDLSGLLQGLYFISMKTEDGRIFSRKCLRE